MSIKLMAAAWEMDLPQTEKMVLLCLCDHANDSGHCWPSASTIARKCSVTDRTVRRSIHALRDKGILSWSEVPGGSNRFHINPCQIVTPDTVSALTMATDPLTQCHPTPDTVSPKPSYNHKEPSTSAEPPKAVAKPDDVSEEVWRDFKRHRQRHGGVSDRVIAGFRREAAKAGWTLERAMDESIIQGWRGFKAEYVQKQAIQPKRQGWQFEP